MNIIYKKLTLAVLTFLLVLITFVTSAYAFLNIANFNLISGIEIGFNSGDYLEVSLDGINYSKEVNPLETRQMNFVNVTTFDNKRFDLGPKYLEEEAIPNKHYISFDLHFRLLARDNDRAYDKVFLGSRINPTYENADNAEGTYAVSRGVRFTSPIDFMYSQDEWIYANSSNTFYAHDALRVGVLNEEEDINFIYDISENRSMGFGKTYGAVDYYNRVVYYNQLEVPDRIPDNMIYNLSNYDLGEPEFFLDTNSLVSNLVLDEEDNYFKGRITVNVWLEGWDANSFDGIYRDSIKIQLMFIAGKLR